MTGSGKGAADGAKPTVTIKKYANRRLYNTQSSSYITLDYLAKMTRDGIDFRVIDAKTGDDITHQVLTQIIMEEEASGEHMLPVNFLRQLIALYGNSMQAMVPAYLDATMDHFRTNQAKLFQAFEGSIENNPVAMLAQQNLALFQAAAAAFMPGFAPAGSNAAQEERAEYTGHARSELDALREQMAEMQRKLEQLAK